jgi:hypothetical protein
MLVGLDRFFWGLYSFSFFRVVKTRKFFLVIVVVALSFLFLHHASVVCLSLSLN